MRRWRQQQRDGFGQISNGFVGSVEEPSGNGGRLDSGADEVTRADQSLELAPRQEIRGPRRIVWRRRCKIGDQRVDFVPRAGRRVERQEQFGEAAHLTRAPRIRETLKYLLVSSS